jgi:hypothetical protein
MSSGNLPFHLANAPRARSAFFFLRVIVQEVILSTTPDTGRLVQEKANRLAGLACLRLVFLTLISSHIATASVLFVGTRLAALIGL